MAARTKFFDTDPVRPYPRVSLEFTEPSRTRGSETPSTDLQTIVNRYRQVGALPPSTLQYGDATELPTSRLEAMEIIASAAAAFADLPLKVRQAVNHDPRNLEAWIKGNPELARQYGLFDDPKQPSPSENPPSSGDPGEGEEGEAA